MLRLASAALAAASLALVAAAPAAAQTPAPSTTCPTFTVLHDDRIGALRLPAGPYTITIQTPGTLSCQQASALFARFLQDFDGRLPDGWRVDAPTSSFRRQGQAFSVARGAAPAPTPAPTPAPAPFDGRCPGTFRVLHDDRIGALELPAGQYTIHLLSDGRFGCRQAARRFAEFLQDYDGVLPGRWRVDSQTATFTRGRRGPGFRVEPAVRRAPSPRPAVPSEGSATCPPFRVLHDDVVGPVRFPAGPYTLIPLRGSGLSCPEASALFRRFLAGAANALPSPWVVDPQTATFTRGRSSSVGFRVAPAS